MCSLCEETYENRNLNVMTEDNDQMMKTMMSLQIVKKYLVTELPVTLYFTA